MVTSNESFNKEYYNRGSLVEIGWREVPWVDGTGIGNWEQSKLRLVSVGWGDIVGEHGWVA